MIHIVDDNESVLEVMGELVASFGYRPRVFSSGGEYLVYASCDTFEAPTAVITDVMMPGLDGFTLMQRVHALHPDVRFIITSGEDHALSSDKLGACIYLRKPIHFDMLESTFRHLQQCVNCGPSKALSESLIDDRCHFGVETHQCPLISSKNP